MIGCKKKHETKKQRNKIFAISTLQILWYEKQRLEILRNYIKNTMYYIIYFVTLYRLREKQASEPAFAHSSRRHMHNPGQRTCILLSLQKRGKK